MEVERNAELLGDGAQRVVVADDERDVAHQLAGAVTQEQVVETVVGLRDEDRDALADVCRVQAQARLGARGGVSDRTVQGLEQPGAGRARAREADALEELARDCVGVLIGVEDVRALGVQGLRETGHEAGPIGAADEEGGGGVFGGGGHAWQSPSGGVTS